MRQKQDFKLPCLRDGRREKGDFLGGAVVKDLPANAEKRVQSLDWEDPWSGKWQSAPVFLPGECYGQRGLESYSPWGHKG